MIPVAKRFVWRRDGNDLLIVFDPRECLRIPDGSGQVEQLLILLREGSRPGQPPSWQRHWAQRVPANPSAFEILRYLNGFEPPADAGSALQIDFAHGCTTSALAWQRHPDCPTCAGTPVRARAS